MIKRFLILLLIIETLRCQSTDKQAFDPEEQRKLAEQYNKVFPFISFEQTITAFPYLARNIKATVFSQLVDENCTQYLQGPNITVKVVIVNNTVDIQYNHSIEWLTIRTESIKSQLVKITKQTQVPDLFMIIDMSDLIIFKSKDQQKRKICDSLPTFTFNKNCSVGSYDRNKLLMIDPYMMNEWDIQVKNIKQGCAKIKFQDKKPMAIFRGLSSSPYYNRASYKQRENIFRYYHRGGFVILSYQYPQLIDARLSDQINGLQASLYELIGKDKVITSAFMPVSQQIKYKYLLSADGFATAWKRIPWSLYSNSVLIKTHSRFIQWFYDKLIPNYHFVLVRNDLKDLIPKLKWLTKNDNRSLEIIKNANAFAQKYLSPKAIQQFTLDLLLKYAKIQQLNLTYKQQKFIIQNKRTIGHILKIQKIKELIKIDHELYKKWKRTTSLTSIPAVIKRYPQIKTSIKIQYMYSVLKQHEMSKHFLKVLIFDNKLYYQGEIRNQQAKIKFTKFLTQVLNEHKLPDMFFIVLFEDQKRYLLNLQIFSALPIFLFSKNVSSNSQSDKFLLPNARFMSEFHQQALKIQQKSMKTEWKLKNNKAFFRGQPSQIDQKMENQVKNNPYRYHHRAGFALLSYQRPDLIDARLTISNNQSIDSMLQQLINRVGYENIIESNVSKDMQFNFKYQLSADQQLSSTKVPLILYSNSILLKPISEVIQWYDQKLIPNKHFLPINQQLTDIFRKVKFLNKNETKVAKMREQIKKFVNQVFSYDDIKKYVFKTLTEYSTFQNLNIEDSLKAQIRKEQQKSNVFPLLQKNFRQLKLDLVIERQKQEQQIEQIEVTDEFQQIWWLQNQNQWVQDKYQQYLIKLEMWQKLIVSIFLLMVFSVPLFFALYHSNKFKSKLIPKVYNSLPPNSQQ